MKPDTAKGSPERFGYSWARFNELTPEQEEQFRRWTVHVDPATGWRGRRFLDVGCGMGRNSYWAMAFGATSGTAIDIDERSLEAARRNLAPYPSVDVRFQSIYDFEEKEAYDIAFSIGVIHHLPDPPGAIARMRSAVKPGGSVLIWVYGRENMEIYTRFLNPMRKLMFSRMPLELVRVLAYVPAALLWLLLRLGLFRIAYFRLLRRFSFAHLHHIVFDQMIPRIAHYWRREEVEALMRGAGLVDIKLAWVNEMSWSAIGRRPTEG